MLNAHGNPRHGEIRCAEPISNYAFNPIAEQALGSNQIIVPQRVNAALGISMKRLVSIVVLLISSSGSLYSAGQPRIELVVQLYKDYAWEAVIDEPNTGETLYSASEADLGRYFTQELTELIVADREQSERTHEIGRIDFALIWASQDPGATMLKIVPSETAGEVIVSFTHPGNGTKIGITYKTTEIDSGECRISDIVYGSGMSLLTRLKAAH